MLRGTWAGDKHLYSFVWILLTAIQPHTPLLQSKPSPKFQTVKYNEGLYNIMPQKEQRKPSKVKIRLLTNDSLSSQLRFQSALASNRLPNQWSLTAKLYFSNDQKTHFGVNTWLTQADHKVSKLCCHSVFPHVVPRPYHKRKQWSGNQRCSHPSYRGPDHTTLLQKKKKEKRMALRMDWEKLPSTLFLHIKEIMPKYFKSLFCR